METEEDQNNSFNQENELNRMEEEFRMIAEALEQDQRLNSIKFKHILTELKSKDEIRILVAIEELANELAIADDSFSEPLMEAFVPEILACLQNECIPDIMFFASVCVVHMLDINPYTSNFYANRNGIEIICEKMQNIEYIDVAENAIKAIEKLSMEHGTTVLKHHAFPILINMANFFLKDIQERIARITLTLISFAPDITAFYEIVIGNLPAVQELFLSLENSDEKMAKAFSVALEYGVNLAPTFEEKSEVIARIINKQQAIFFLDLLGGVKDVSVLIGKMEMVESVLKIFSKICYYTMDIFDFSIQNGLSTHIEAIFNMIEANENSFVSFQNISFELIYLINSLLSFRKEPIPLLMKVSTLVNIKLIENPLALQKIEYYKNNISLFKQLVFNTYKRIPFIFSTVPSAFLRYLSLIVFEKIYTFADDTLLKELIAQVDISKFVAELLASKNPVVLANCYLILETSCSRNQDLLNQLERYGASNIIESIVNDQETVIQLIKNLNANNINQKANKIEELTAPQTEICLEFRDCFKKIDDFLNSSNIKGKGLYILDELKSINNLFFTDEGELAVEKLSNLLSKHKFITFFELRESNIISNLVKFLFPLQETDSNLKNKMEEEKVDSSNKKEPEIIDVDKITKRLTYSLSKLSPHYETLISVLNDICANEELTKGLSSSSKENKLNILEDLKYLCQRIRFQLKLIENTDITHLLSKKDFIAYETKASQLREIPNLMISVEQYGTLEIVEDYLLNRFLGKNTLLTFLQKSTSQGGDSLAKEDRGVIESEGEEGSLGEDDIENFEDEDAPPIRKMSRKLSTPSPNKALMPLNTKFNKILSKDISVFELTKELKTNTFKLDYKIIPREVSKLSADIDEKAVVSNYNYQFNQLHTKIQKVSEIFHVNPALKDALQLIAVLFEAQVIFHEQNSPGSENKCCYLGNPKISNDINKVVEDPVVIIGNILPNEIPFICKNYKFMIDFKTRLSYFKYFEFSKLRSMFYFHQANRNTLKDLEALKIGKIPRKKLRVSRQKILESSITFMEKFGGKKDLLEFEFLGEVGSGLGPTLEFYDLVCQEIKKMELWQKTDDFSLFPICFNTQKFSSEEIKRQFRMIGNIVGRAIFDLRTIDLPINKIWWKIIKNEDCQLSDLYYIDSALYSQISKLQKIHKLSLSKEATNEDLLYDGIELEELCISFVIPGTTIELIPRGSNIFLNIENIGSYLENLQRIFFYESMKPQIKGFKQGISKIINEKAFDCFYANEVERLYFGESKSINWDEKELMDNIIPAYGYTKESQSYLNFILFLKNLKIDERKEFLKFITGAPRLPLGGLSALTPKITVVKKHPTGREKVNEILPSVMTCQNYVKLPDYSSFYIMETKLRFAIQEGQQSFSLS